MRYLLTALLLCTTVAAEEGKLDAKTIRAQHRLQIFNSDGRMTGIGTGIAIDKRHLLTAKHVATSNGNTVWVNIFDDDGDDTGCSIIAHVVRIAVDADLALIETTADLDVWQKPQFGECKVGDTCIAIGAAFAWSPYTQFRGTFTARHSTPFPGLNQIACVAIRGMSGGGVYSADGKLIGVCVMARGDDFGEVGVVMLTVPSVRVKMFLDGK